MEDKNKSTADVVKYTKRTVSGILWGKFLDYLSESTWSSIISVFSKGVLSLFIGLCLIDLPLALQIVKKGVFMGDFAIIKMVSAFILVFHWKIWVGWISDALGSFSTKLEEDTPLFYGIPVHELIDYIFEHETFSRIDVEKRFAISRKSFDSMAKEMERVCIFQR